MLQTLDSAFADIRAGVRLRRVWMALASEDIGDQHRQTMLGPLWLLVNYLAFAGTFIFVFQHSDGSMPDYPAYVATGLLVWFYMMEIINHSVSLFVREEALIKGTTLPVSVYVMRLAMQAAIRAGYALVGCLGILLLSGTEVTAAWTWSALGMMLILAVSPAVIAIFGLVGAYFPDSQFVVSNLMRVGMFLTPVFWVYTPGEGGIRSAFYWYNPFTYFLEIVRAPIVHGTMPGQALLLCLAMGLAVWILALLMLGRLRKRLAFVI